MTRDSIAVRVVEAVEVASGVKQLVLAAADGAALPPFSAGAHVVVEMEAGGAIRRNPYTLTGSPRIRETYRISVRRHEDGPGGSRFLHDSASVGSLLRIGLPQNQFPLAFRARKHVFIAGGIGVTPFLPMAETLVGQGGAFELHYACRSPAYAAYADELVERYGGRARLYFSDRNQRIRLGEILPRQPLGTHLYVCGPERMTEAVLAEAAAAGWPPESLHCERFTAPASSRPYSVRLARAGRDIAVASSQSLLEALEASGVDAPSLCRGGACGECRAPVLAAEGRIEHRDHFLTEAEKASNAWIMPCVSGFEGPLLTLDL